MNAKAMSVVGIMLFFFAGVAVARMIPGKAWYFRATVSAACVGVSISFFLLLLRWWRK
jgi:hypothetical protein